jgi:hypothetical protein
VLSCFSSPSLPANQPYSRQTTPLVGWLVWDNARYNSSTLTNFAVTRDVISFNLNAIHNNGCVPQTTFTYTLNDNIFTVKAFVKPEDSLRACTQAGTPFSMRVALITSAGTYRVRIIPTPLARPFDTTVTVVQ